VDTHDGLRRATSVDTHGVHKLLQLHKLLTTVLMDSVDADSAHGIPACTDRRS
jgi:hypothetical protein